MNTLDRADMIRLLCSPIASASASSNYHNAGTSAWVAFEPIQQRPGLRCSLVVKAPGEGDGGVDDKAAQRRPSLIKSLILRPPSV
jgi:hypothetical protein